MPTVAILVIAAGLGASYLGGRAVVHATKKAAHKVAHVFHHKGAKK